MPDIVIARMNRLSAGQPRQLTFLDRKGRPIGDLDFPGVTTDTEPIDQGALAGVDGVPMRPTNKQMPMRTEKVTMVMPTKFPKPMPMKFPKPMTTRSSNWRRKPQEWKLP